MFTIRFNTHQSSDVYKSYSCRAYFVTHTDAGEARIRMDFPDGSNYEEQVGPDTPYDVAFVTNGESRTIDVIRSKMLVGHA